MRTIAYVDGFNLYYGCLKGTRYKWLDLRRLFERLLPPGHSLVKIKYFTARVSSLPSDPDAPRRQDVYLRALRAHLGGMLEIIEGEFLIKEVWLPRKDDPSKFVEVLRPEEKGSDVNLAVHLVHDAWGDAFDCAAVASNDGDLAGALKIVKQAKRKRVLLCTPGAPRRHPLVALKRWSHKQVGIGGLDVANAQLPSLIPGTVLEVPRRWK